MSQRDRHLTFVPWDEKRRHVADVGAAAGRQHSMRLLRVEVHARRDRRKHFRTYARSSRYRAIGYRKDSFPSAKSM